MNFVYMEREFTEAEFLCLPAFPVENQCCWNCCFHIPIHPDHDDFAKMVVPDNVICSLKEFDREVPALVKGCDLWG